MKTVSCTLPVCLFICLRVCMSDCVCEWCAGVCVCGCGTPTCSSSCFVKCEFNTCDLTFLGELRQLRRNLHKLRIRPVLACHIRLPHCHSPFSVAAAALCRALGEHLSDTMLRCFVCLVEQLSDPATLVASVPSVPFALNAAACCPICSFCWLN